MDNERLAHDAVAVLRRFRTVDAVQLDTVPQWVLDTILALEREVSIARAEQARMEAELRHAVRTREDLIAVVSHDLRNPLGTITLGASMIATDDALAPRTRKHVDMIERSAHRME